jgi:hypothetical protein
MTFSADAKWSKCPSCGLDVVNEPSRRTISHKAPECDWFKLQLSAAPKPSRTYVRSEPIISEAEQLGRWVRGNPIHRGAVGAADSECCPDFSCCYPELMQPLVVRLAYEVATPAQRADLLGVFLAALLEKLGAAGAVHIAGRVRE